MRLPRRRHIQYGTALQQTMRPEEAYPNVGAQAMRLAPFSPDSSLNYVTTTFTMNRPSRFAQALRNLPTNIQGSGQAEVVETVVASLRQRGIGVPRNNSELSRIVEVIQRVIRGWSPKTKDYSCSIIGQANLYAYLKDSLCVIDDNYTLAEVVNAVISATFADLTQVLQDNLFLEVGSLHPNEQAENLSIKLQFLIATLNICAKERSRVIPDFGGVLQSDDMLCQDFITRVRTAIERKQPIEQAIGLHFESNLSKYGFTTIEQFRTIYADALARFDLNYKTVHGSPHYDEFLVVGDTPGGNIIDFNSRICSTLDHFVQANFPTVFQQFSDKIRERRLAFKSQGYTSSAAQRQPKPIPRDNHIAAWENRISHNQVIDMINRAINSRSDLPALSSLLWLGSLPNPCLSHTTVQLYLRPLVSSYEEISWEVYNLMREQANGNEEKIKYLSGMKSHFGLQADEDILRLTQQMTRSIYTAVTYEFGGNSHAYGLMQDLTNGWAPEKVNLAIGALFQAGRILNCLKVKCCGYDGYVCKGASEDIQRLKLLATHYQDTTYFTEQRANLLELGIMQLMPGRPLPSKGGRAIYAYYLDLLRMIIPNSSFRYDKTRFDTVWFKGGRASDLDTIQAYLSAGETVPASPGIVASAQPEISVSSAPASINFPEVRRLEQGVGTFSTQYLVAGNVRGQNIALCLKPAAQLLSQLLRTHIDYSPLTDGTGFNYREVSILPFNNRAAPGLKISGNRLKRLVRSARVYLNTDTLPLRQYIEDQVSYTFNEPRVREAAWFNLSTGICHAQEIDLLIEQRVENGVAIAYPRRGQISDTEISLVLLSAPALNFGYIPKDCSNQNKCAQVPGSTLHSWQKELYIIGYYLNIFNAAVDKGCEYICMPAVGLGVFRGEPDLYFRTLFSVAREFPSLKIVYHPGNPTNVKRFERLTAQKPSNVYQASKDILYLSEALRRDGKRCALLNPADAESVRGIYDIGQYWKIITPNPDDYVEEKHIASCSTAPLGSKGINGRAYEAQHVRAFSFATGRPQVVSMPTGTIPSSAEDDQSIYASLLLRFLAHPATKAAAAVVLIAGLGLVVAGGLGLGVVAMGMAAIVAEALLGIGAGLAATAAPLLFFSSRSYQDRESRNEPVAAMRC